LADTSVQSVEESEPAVEALKHARRVGISLLVVLGRDPYCARSTLETEMATGTVKWFNPTKGYGFIQPSGGGGKDVFVHISAVERAGLHSLNEGQTIEYEIENNRGKESATNLKVK
jgi:cold shock protein